MLYEKFVFIYEFYFGFWKKYFDGRYYFYKELSQLFILYIKEYGFIYIELFLVYEYFYDCFWGY